MLTPANLVKASKRVLRHTGEHVSCAIVISTPYFGSCHAAVITFKYSWLSIRLKIFREIHGSF